MINLKHFLIKLMIISAVADSAMAQATQEKESSTFNSFKNLFNSNKEADKEAVEKENSIPTTTHETSQPTKIIAKKGYGPDWDFTQLVKKTMPAVIKIRAEDVKKIDTSSSADKRRGHHGFPFGNGHSRQMEDMDDIFKFFFEMPKAQKQRRPSSGSGFITSSTKMKNGKYKSYIVTNHHIIGKHDKVTVIFDDNKGNKREIGAIIEGKDKRTDLALLSVETKKRLPVVKFGDSDKLEVGQWCLAIGSSLEMLTNTVSIGIISTVNRNLPGQGLVSEFIQTDISINPGNSGGPLFNMKGEVIGVNNAIVNPRLGTGIAFAIPSSITKEVIAQIKKLGRTRRGWLGLLLQEINEPMAEALGLSNTYGALVNQVLAGPCSAKLKQRDIITHFNGKQIQTVRKLQMMVARADIDKASTLTVLRNGKVMNIKIVLGEYEKEALDAQTPQEKKKAGDNNSLANKIYKEYGLRLAPLTQTLREKHSLPASLNGLLIEEIDNDTHIALPVRKGSVLIEADNVKVTTLQGIHKVLNDARNKKPARKNIFIHIFNPPSHNVYWALSISK